ncbi:hypothetical protein V6N13_109259 [Hibiscus sabdariffa]
MRKMGVADATPIRVTLPTPTNSPAHSPVAAPDQAGLTALAEAKPSPTATPEASPINSTTHTPVATPEIPNSRQTTPDSPLGSAPTPPQSPPPAQSEEAISLHILQLRSQAATIHGGDKANLSAATQPMSPANPSEGAGKTEEVHFSADAENDIFDWHTPMEHHAQPDAANIPESSTAQKHKAPAPTTKEILSAESPTPDTSTKRKGKTPVGRTITRNTTSSPDDEEQITPRPAKRQRGGSQVIITDSDDSSSAEQPVEHPEQSTDPFLSLSYYLNVVLSAFSSIPCISAHALRTMHPLRCKGAVFGLHHIVKKKLHFEERMIQGFRETMISAMNDQPKQIKECTKKQQIQAERSYTDAALDQKTQNSPMQKNEYMPKTPNSAGKKYTKGNAI